MSHTPYNENEEQFLRDENPVGWECSKCRCIWAPTIRKCESKSCNNRRVQENTTTPDTRKFLTE
jgi:hypothetical protein